MASRDRHHLACAVLCDPDHDAYRAGGIGQWGSNASCSTRRPAHVYQYREDFPDVRVLTTAARRD